MTSDPIRPTQPEPASGSAMPAPHQPGPTESPSFGPQPVVESAPRIQARPASRRSTGMWINVILVAAVVVAVGGVAFAVGRNTAPVSAGAGGNRFPGNGNFPIGSLAPDGSGGPGAFGGRGGLGAAFTLSGTVQSVSGDTLTITTANGQTLEFALGPDTTYDTRTDASASSVTTGSNVEIQLGDGAAGFVPGASAAPSGPIGTASRVTVVP